MTTIGHRGVVGGLLEIDDEKRKVKKMTRGELITAGLATVATVHAAHTVIKGIEGRKKRLKELKEGKISPEEARKAHLKANLKDAGSIGLAALGIGGAVAEWKEVQEKRREHHEFEKQCKERHEKRAWKRSHSVNGSSNGSGPASISEPNGWDRSNTPHYHDGNPYGREYAIDY